MKVNMGRNRSQRQLNSDLTWLFCLIYYFLTFVISSWATTSTNAYGKYFLLVAVGGAFVFYAIGQHMAIRVRINIYFLWLLLFTFAIYLSSLFALVPSVSRSIAFDMLEISVVMILMYIIFQDIDSVDALLKIIMFGGFFIVVYAIVFYGWNNIIDMLNDSKRISNSAINANILGMCAAYSIVINVYYIIYDKIKWWNLMIIIEVFILAVSGSRKALIIGLGGAALLYVCNIIKTRKNAKKLFISFALLFVAFFALYGLTQSQIFSQVNSRMAGLIAGFIGSGPVDASTNLRLRFVEIGIDIFKNNPIFGIGCDNAKFITAQYVGKEMYLHNNFVELLAGTGIVGFLSYYLIFGVILYRYIRYRDFDNKEFYVCFVILFFRIIMDYGYVCYNDKSTHFFILTLFIMSELLKRKKTVELEQNKA